MSKKEFSEFNARYPSSTGSYQGAPGLARSISPGQYLEGTEVRQGAFASHRTATP